MIKYFDTIQVDPQKFAEKLNELSSKCKEVKVVCHMVGAIQSQFQGMPPSPVIIATIELVFNDELSRSAYIASTKNPVHTLNGK